jgi:tetratricopeptide (TPR) repeat protein
VIRIAGVSDPIVWTGALAWALLLTGAWILRRRALIAFSLVWLAVTPIPTLNIIPLNYPIADRYVYLPSIGFAILVAGAIVAGAQRLAPRRAGLAVAAATGALVVVSALAIFERAVDWRSEEALLTSTLRDNPAAPEALRYSARLASKAGDSTRAFAFAHRAIDALPTAPESWRVLGDLFWDGGKNDSAEVAYRTEWNLGGHRGETANRLGIIAAARADGPESVKWFRSAHARSRRDPGIRENLGRALIASGQRDEGRAMLEALVADQPSRADAWGILAYSYWREGDETRAREVLARGLRALPRDPTLNRLAAQWRGAQPPAAASSESPNRADDAAELPRPGDG